MEYLNYSAIATGKNGELYFISKDGKKARRAEVNFWDGEPFLLDSDVETDWLDLETCKDDDITITQSMFYTKEDGLRRYYTPERGSQPAIGIAEGRLVCTNILHWGENPLAKYGERFRGEDGEIIFSSRLDWLTMRWDGEDFSDPDKRISRYRSLLKRGVSDYELKEADKILYRCNLKGRRYDEVIIRGLKKVCIL